MSSRFKRIKLAASAVGMLTASVLALNTAPASASGTYNGLDCIMGSGDWHDEGIVDVSHNTNSNATCLWQKILWGGRQLTSTSQIDGQFGPTTVSAAKSWQSTWMGSSSADGSAGKNAFIAASPYLGDSDGDGNVDTYYGTDHTISMSLADGTEDHGWG